MPDFAFTSRIFTKLNSKKPVFEFIYIIIAQANSKVNDFEFISAKHTQSNAKRTAEKFHRPFHLLETAFDSPRLARDFADIPSNRVGADIIRPRFLLHFVGTWHAVYLQRLDVKD